MNSSTAARNGDEDDGPFPFRKSMNCLTDCCSCGVSEPMTSARCSAAMVAFQLQVYLGGLPRRGNVPDCLKVHFKIVVYQHVSHAGYRRPVDLRVPLPVRFADPLCRLTENLKVADDCVLERTRSKDSIPARRPIPGGFSQEFDERPGGPAPRRHHSPARRRIRGDSANAFDDVPDVRALRFHNGTASLSTESRIKGLSERRITTWTRRPKSCSRSATKLPGNQGVVSPVTSTRRSTSLSSVSSPRATGSVL